MYTTKWVKSFLGTLSGVCGKANSVTVIHASKCLPLNTPLTESISAPMVTVSELKALCVDKVSLNLAVPLPTI